MEHIYIFDYNNGKIYHGNILPDETPEEYLDRHNLKQKYCLTMITESETDIEELD